MNMKQSFKLALKSLLVSKMRSFLTMLGIIIGVASVIILVSLIDGMTKDIVKNFESMGTNLINVTIMGRGGNRSVSPEKLMEFAEKNSDVIGAVSPSISVQGATVKYEANNITTTCSGVNEFYRDIRNTTVSSGRNIEYLDSEARQKNCVIGTYIQKELFENANPIGQIIKINSQSFRIVGVLTDKQGGVQGSQDDIIIIPYTLAQKLSGNFTISSYAFSAATKETVDKAMEKINEYLLSVFSNTNAYRVFNQAEMLSTINDMTGKMTALLVGIAGISLLVGGIGIMNIMLVSVSERTKEIGIRKSLGARQWDIMGQFIVEAATTSSIGGILGIILGVGLSYAATLFKMPISISGVSILIAFSVSLIIGMTFGFFPAQKAAKLNPIDALRYE